MSESEQYTIDWDEVTECIISIPSKYPKEKRETILRELGTKPKVFIIDSEIMISFQHKETAPRPPAELRAKLATLDKSEIKNEDFREADYWIYHTLKWVLKEGEEI